MSNDKKNGRPESFSAEYFSHSVHESDVLKVMYRKYKYEGFVAYFRLKEQATKSDFHRIELKNDTPKSIEEKWYSIWEEAKSFQPNLDNSPNEETESKEVNDVSLDQISESENQEVESSSEDTETSNS